MESLIFQDFSNYEIEFYEFNDFRYSGLEYFFFQGFHCSEVEFFEFHDFRVSSKE